MTDFDTIREALFLVIPETQIVALNALNSLRAVLAERDAEIKRLRGMALDLSKVPEEWEFLSMDRLIDGSLEITLGKKWSGPDVIASSPTPAAALNAAIERTK